MKRQAQHLSRGDEILLVGWAWQVVSVTEPGPLAGHDFVRIKVKPLTRPSQLATPTRAQMASGLSDEYDVLGTLEVHSWRIE